MKNIPIYIIVHCSASSFGDKETIDRWHKENGWDGVGYQYIIGNGHIKKHDKYNADLDGMIEEGRGDFESGAHCKGYNSKSIGICLIGDMKDLTPEIGMSQLGKYLTNKQHNSLLTLIMRLVTRHDIETKKILGHCEVSEKTCPDLDMDKLRELITIVFEV